MKTFRLRYIDWDTDQRLPETVIVNDVSDFNEAVDVASDRYGYCILAAKVEQVTNLRLVRGQG